MLPTGTHPAWKCVVLIVLYSIRSGFASPVQNVSEQSEVASSNLHMTLIDVYEHVVSFFRPMTCQYKDEKTLIPCHIGEGHNTTVCLENKCCPSEISPALTCYMPFTDKMQMTFRLLLLVAGGLLLLGCLPLCCCVCLQRSPCINPLRRGNKKLRKIVSERKAHSEDVSIPLLGSHKTSKDHKNNKKKRGTST